MKDDTFQIDSAACGTVVIVKYLPPSQSSLLVCGGQMMGSVNRSFEKGKERGHEMRSDQIRSGTGTGTEQE